MNKYFNNFYITLRVQMFSLTKFAARNLLIGKSATMQFISHNYSQLLNKNVFLFASTFPVNFSQDSQFAIPGRFDQ